MDWIRHMYHAHAQAERSGVPVEELLGAERERSARRAREVMRQVAGKAFV